MDAGDIWRPFAMNRGANSAGLSAGDRYAYPGMILGMRVNTTSIKSDSDSILSFV